MAWFAPAGDPPPEIQGAEAFVLWIAQDLHGIPNAKLDDAIDHDLHIVGDDALNFIEQLEDRLGDKVWEWPWGRFVQLREGLSVSFPFMLIWQLFTWPARGRFSYESNRERLTLRHVAKVLDRGEWVDP